MTTWTNPSVSQLAGDQDPIKAITDAARAVVLSAIERGWSGPPYDPFELAELQQVPVSPRDDVADARVVPLGSSRLMIEYNPSRPQARVRFSIAHEIAHTLFPDCSTSIRNRIAKEAPRSDDWQLELLCNLAAAEFLMPIGTVDSLGLEEMSIENVLGLQRRYGVSVESILLRLAKLTSKECAVFAAAPMDSTGNDISYRLDYCISSRGRRMKIPSGTVVPSPTILAQCTAVGFTAKGSEKWVPRQGAIKIECVGIPAFPGNSLPRIAGILASQDTASEEHILRVRHIRGSVVEPRESSAIIAFIVNDKTPNWGGGLSLEIRRKWPSAQEHFRAWAKTNPATFKLGNIFEASVSEGTVLAALIAQSGYGPSVRPRIRYQALRECLLKLGETASSKHYSVHLPKIGTGLSSGRWEIVEELLDETLVSQGIPVLVYTLPDQAIGTEQQATFQMGSRNE